MDWSSTTPLSNIVNRVVPQGLHKGKGRIQPASHSLETTALDLSIQLIPAVWAQPLFCKCSDFPELGFKLKLQMAIIQPRRDQLRWISKEAERKKQL